MPTDRFARLALLACLYFSQGLPFGYFTIAIPVMLRAHGMSPEAIGLASVVALPWAFKFLGAPLIDRTRARGRKPWILPLQACTIVLMLVISTIPPTPDRLFLLGVLVFTSNLLAATQDIPTDALAIDLLGVDDRGLGNGVQVGAYRFGMIVGGGGLLAAYDRIGWQGACLAMAGMLTLATIPVALHREPPATAHEPPRYGEALKRLLARPGMLPWFGLLALYKAGESLGGSVVKIWLKDHGWALDEIGLLLGLGGSLFGMAGALFGGWAVRYLGRQQALVGFGAFQAAAVALWAVPAVVGNDRNLVIAVTAIEHLASGTATAALFTAMMDACEPRTAASDYTLQACVVVSATIAAAMASGFALRAFGFTGHFVFAGALCALAMAYAAVRPPPTLA
jgi:MFS transporter, PAT family, beta-lactamase induction signal transducer AmpG